MTTADFRAWITRMGFTHEQAAAALGVSRATISKRLSGENPIDKEAELACFALEQQTQKNPHQPKPVGIFS